jgi:hypothetical protein
MTASFFTAHRAVLTAFVSLALGTAQCASATPTASGKSFDVSIDVAVLGQTLVAVTPNKQVEFADLTIAFNDSKLTPSLTLGDAASVYLSTDELTAETQWIPGDVFLAVGSRAMAANVDLSVANPLAALGVNASLLDVAAAQIQATAAISGTCPAVTAPKNNATTSDLGQIVDDLLFHNEFEVKNLIATNTSQMPGLEIDVAGVPLLNLPADPQINTSVNIGGIGSLTLNKQSVTGDGITSLSSVVDGLLLDIHLSLLGSSVIDATVNISHSEASITCN